MADAGELHLLLANIPLVGDRLRAIAAARGEHELNPVKYPLHRAVVGTEQAAVALAHMLYGKDADPLVGLGNAFLNAAASWRKELERKIAEREAAGAAKH